MRAKVEQGGTVQADGTGPATGSVYSGQYQDGGLRRLTSSAIHAGTPGALGRSGGGDSAGAPGGRGGGVLMLVAARMFISGLLSVQGEQGADGQDGGCQSPDCSTGGPGGGGGGGSGGAVRLVADDALISGAIALDGGAGGAGGQRITSSADGTTSGADYTGLTTPGPDGPAGSLGCALISVRTLRAPATLVGSGPVILALRRPVDPANPLSRIASHYDTGTLHNLPTPFYSFYHAAPGAAALFRRPRTEPFAVPGGLAQEFDRVEMVSTGGQVTLAPLGRLLISRRQVSPSVAPFPSSSSRRYFPSTRHSLSGPFLAYWQRHGGARLLGVPLSEAGLETNGDGSGRAYPTQWFDYGRLELHDGSTVQPGLLGVQDLARRGWL